VVKYFDDVAERYPQYLNDEANIVAGFADRIYFPKNEAEVVEIVKLANKLRTKITVSGGGTGLSGGRVPLGGWILATDDMTLKVDPDIMVWRDPETHKEYNYVLKESKDKATITIPISLTLKSFQTLVRELGWFYPPDPTERTAFLGGTVATNASGSRSFKFGSTRDWVDSIRVVLGNGEVAILGRDESSVVTENFAIVKTNRKTYEVIRPSYSLPKTRKNVATPVLTNDSHSVDLFIGSGGLFGIITEITLSLIKTPKEILNIFAYCPSHQIALKLIQECQNIRSSQNQPLPMSVEYLDSRAMDIIRRKDKSVSTSAKALIILEQDAKDDDELSEYIEFWLNKFTELGINETSVAQTQREIEMHKELRHSVPEYVNSVVKSFGQSKHGSDFSVSEDLLNEIFEMANSLGQEFEAYQKENENSNEIGYAIWGHGGDCHLHLNFIPRSDAEGKAAKSLMFKFLKRIVDLNGSIAAEHGLGKKEFENKPAVYYAIGASGIDEIRQIKITLDPNLILNPVNLIG